MTMAATSGQLRKVTLGSSDLKVTDVCLGTMTWGVQNTEAEAHTQLDYALKERGVTFVDTAEMYPVPMFAPGWVPGTTESYIGSWLAKNPGWRERIVIATKVCGNSSRPSDVAARRSDPPSGPAPLRLDAASVRQACDASLRRLRTDYIDLYQIHWPDRYVPIFGTTQYDPTQERDSVPIAETLGALWDLIQQGKIRHYGLSNETTYGLCEWVKAADAMGAPRPITIQNSFCLLNRAFGSELAEACAPSHHNVGLLPYSPLGGGALSGKYRDKKLPEGSRFQRYPQFMTRYVTPAAVDAVDRYAAIASARGMSVATLALAWCRSRWFVASTIVGATDMDQLKENLDAFTVTLDEGTLKAIDEVHIANKDPVLSL
jgi:aryl-alcohol dehydrogenase-like predicted oxidoreductase